MDGRVKVLYGASFLLLMSALGFLFAVETLMPFITILILCSFLLFGIGLYFDRHRISLVLKHKSTLLAFNSFLLLFFSLIFLSAINFLSVRFNKIYDFTLLKNYSLSPLTVKILEETPEDLEFYFFYKSGTQNLEITKKNFFHIFKLYEQSKKNIKLSFVELNENPILAQEFKAQKDLGEVFLRLGKCQNRIESQFVGQFGFKFNEQDITNALIKCKRTRQQVVYFSQGHLEKSLDEESDSTGLGQLRLLLEKNSYKIEKVNLIENPEIPENVKTLMIIEPQITFQSATLDKIQNFLKKGGRLFVTFDNKNDAGLNSIMQKWGVQLEPQYVFNILNSNMGAVVNPKQPTVAIDYSPESLITQVFNRNHSMVFMKPNYFKTENKLSSIKLTELVLSPLTSVKMADLNTQKYEGEEPQSYPLAVLVEGDFNSENKTLTDKTNQEQGKKTKDSEVLSPHAQKKFENFGKIVLVADSDFISNGLIAQNVNRDFVLNSIAYLNEENDLISITPKELQTTALKMPLPEFNYFYKFSVMGIILPLPIVFLVVGLFFWYRRKNA